MIMKTARINVTQRFTALIKLCKKSGIRENVIFCPNLLGQGHEKICSLSAQTTDINEDAAVNEVRFP